MPGSLRGGTHCQFRPLFLRRQQKPPDPPGGDRPNKGNGCAEVVVDVAPTHERMID